MRMDKPVRPSSATLARDSLRLVGDRWPGESQRHGLLFAHGLGQTRAAWRTSAARLAQAGHAAVIFDARGHGNSGRNPDSLAYSPEQMVDDLAAWAATFAQPPVLIGASMGGLTGLAAQGAHRCFAALVLVDITPRWEPEGVARILAFMRAHNDGFDSIAQAADVIAAYMPHRPRKSAQAMASLLIRDDDGRWRWHWDARLVEDMNRDSDARQAQLFDAARRIDVPTLLLTGSESDVVSRHTIDEFLALVPHARHHEIANARHLVAGDDNDAFAASVSGFLATVAAPVKAGAAA